MLKITSANLCKPIYDIINYSTFICPFESEKFGKEGKIIQKFEYLENKKSFLDEIKKTFFIVFEGLSLDEKNKNLISFNNWLLSSCESLEIFSKYTALNLNLPSD